MDARAADPGRGLQDRPWLSVQFLSDLGATYRIAGSRTWLMVNVPVPVQFAVAPVTDQVPVICPPPTVPSRVRVFASTPEDRMT